MTKTPEHSPLGASSAHRWMNCPGSVALVASLPAQPENADMRAGMAAHWVAEECLRTGADADQFVDTEIAFIKHVFTEDDAVAVQAYLDFCRELTADDRAKYVGIEQRFHLSGLDAALWGRNDFCAYVTAEKALYVVDYKHGIGRFVSPEENRQIMYYGLGALLELAESGLDVEHVVLVVAQPRSYQSTDAVRQWQTTPGRLLDYGLELMAAAQATRQPDAPLVCGDYCDTCPAAGACPALYESAIAAAGLTPGGEHKEPPAPETLSPEELGRRLELAETLRIWLRAVTAYAHGEAMRGRVPGGHKLIEKGGGRRAFADPAAAVLEATEEFEGYQLSHFLVTKPVSPAQLEKVVGKKNAAAFLEKRLAVKPKTFALVPLSHKGDAVAPPALSEFEPIDIGAFTDE